MAMYGLFSGVNSLLVSGSAQSKCCLFHIGYISFIRKYQYQFGTTKLFFFIGPSILGENPHKYQSLDFKQLYFSSWWFIGCYLHMVAHLRGSKITVTGCPWCIQQTWLLQLPGPGELKWAYDINPFWVYDCWWFRNPANQLRLVGELRLFTGIL